MGYLNAGGTAGLLNIQNFPVPDKQKCYLGLLRASNEPQSLIIALSAVCLHTEQTMR